jgi:hypothetical protein
MKAESQGLKRNFARTGALHTTAISTVAITGAIFSLGATLMASSEQEARLYASQVFAPVTQITPHLPLPFFAEWSLIP